MARSWPAILVCLTVGTSAEGACPGGATVTYLANEGVMISGRAGAVLIDALFREGIEPYPTLADDTRAVLESASAPFDRVAWVLVSHVHADHFSAESVAKHLRANPQVRVASTPAVISKLRDLVPDDVADGLLAIDPPARKSSLVVDGAGLRIEAYALSHGENMGVDNLGFVVELDGTTVLHMGDSEALGDALAETGIVDRDIDIGLVPYWYVYGEAWSNALGRFGTLQTVGLVHLPAFPDRNTMDTLRTRQPSYSVLREPGQELCAR